jgi:FKBP-type peptidyl-prolyl cis-trans isomerase 2
VTVPVPQDASGTFGFDLVATNDANQTATASASVPVVADGEIAVEPLQSSFEVREGNRYTVPVAIVSNADVAGEVTATGDAVVATNFTALEPESSTGGFVTIEAPGEATEQEIEVSVDDRTETVTVAVGPASDGPTPGEGEQAELRHTARLPNGTVVETAVPGIAQGSFPKSQYFQEGQGAQPLTVRMGGAGGAPPGVASAAANMTEGESLTITLAPEDAYGPERRTQDLEATTELQREIEFDRRPDQLQDFPRNRLPDAFDLEGKEEGDIVDFEQDVGDETIVLRFKILSLSEDTVSLERYAEEGETTTFYPAWPNATEVVSVTDETITYRSTPPDSASEEPFAWDQDPNSHQAKWGNTTTVDEMNETAIVLLHQPEEGIEYNVSSRFGQERSYRVEDVTQDTITVSTPNQDPRGGETVTFDLTLVDISEAQQRGLPPGLGGG